MYWAWFWLIISWLAASPLITLSSRPRCSLKYVSLPWCGVCRSWFFPARAGMIFAYHRDTADLGQTP